MTKVMEWIAAHVAAWIRGKLTGSVEIHFHDGTVTRLSEHRTHKPPNGGYQKEKGASFGISSSLKRGSSRADR